MDGEILTHCMIEYNFDVTVKKAFEVKAVDQSTFEDYQNVCMRPGRAFTVGPYAPSRAYWAALAYRSCALILSCSRMRRARPRPDA